MMADDWNSGAERVVFWNYGLESFESRFFSCKQSSVVLLLRGCRVDEKEGWVWRGMQGSFLGGEAPGELFCLRVEHGAQAAVSSPGE